MTKPVLAFAHANGMPGGSYRHFLAPLTSHYDVRAPELLGHDPRFPVDRNWQNLSQELEEYLAALPKPFFGVGHSMGGVLMFMIARRHPDWFRALVMLDPPLFNGWMAPLINVMRLIGQADRVTPAGKSKGRRAYWASQEDVQAYFSRPGFFGRLDPQCRQDYLDAGLEPDGEGFRLRFRVDVEVEIFRGTPGNLSRGPRLAVPAALVSGQQTEAIFSKAHARHVRYHRMTWARAPGGHMFPLEHPQEASALLLSLLQDLASARAWDGTHGEVGK